MRYCQNARKVHGSCCASISSNFSLPSPASGRFHCVLPVCPACPACPACPTPHSQCFRDRQHCTQHLVLTNGTNQYAPLSPGSRYARSSATVPAASQAAKVYRSWHQDSPRWQSAHCRRVVPMRTRTVQVQQVSAYLKSMCAPNTNSARVTGPTHNGRYTTYRGHSTSCR